MVFCFGGGAGFCVRDGFFFLGRYVGEWQNDLQHGQGTFYFADGSCFRGLWKEVLYLVPFCVVPFLWIHLLFNGIRYGSMASILRNLILIWMGP